MGMTPTEDKIWHLGVRIKGIEFDVACLERANYNKRNDKSIADLKRALDGYRAELEMLRAQPEAD
jgi:hypothetical protein